MADPLRAVFVAHSAARSGGELALVRLIKALEDVEAHAILGEHGPLEADLAAVGARVEVLAVGELGQVRRSEVRLGSLRGAYLRSTFRVAEQLQRRLRELSPDVVHTNSLKSAIYGGLAARWARRPLVWHVREPVAPGHLPRQAVVAFRGLARVLPHAVICNSEAVRASLGRRRGAYVIASPAALSSSPIPPAEQRDPSTTIVMVGRLSPQKGQHLFLEALSRAFDAGDVHALVVGSAMFGDDAYAATLPKLARSLGIADWVEFPGFVTDVTPMLDRSDVLVVASVVPEGFGQVVVEGMSRGLAVIAPDDGGPAEIITHNEDGLLFRSGDVRALADALRLAHADAALRGRLGAAAAVRARAFTPERIAPAVVEVWRRVIGPTR